MRIRGNHIVIGVMALVGLLLVYGIVKGGAGPSVPPSTQEGNVPPLLSQEDDFLAQVRQLAKTSPPSGEVGGVAAVGTPADYIPIIEAPAEYHVGVVPNDGISTHPLEIRNRGKAPLEILNVTTTCLCTTGKMQSSVIPPGGSGTLNISIDPNRIPGWKSTKTLTLHSNDPKHSAFEIDVSADVEPECVVEPMFIQFGEVPKGQTREAQAVIRQVDTRQPLRLESATLAENQRSVAVEYREVPPEARQNPELTEYIVTARVLPDAPVGEVKGYVDLGTAYKRISSIRLHFEGVIKAFYTLSDPVVRIGRPEPGKERAGTARITSNKPLVIDKLAITGSDFAVALEPAAGGAAAEIVVSVLPSATPGVKSEYVTFTVSADGEQPVTERLQVVGMVRTEQAATGGPAAAAPPAV